MVHDNDDRQEYYELESQPLRRLFETHAVALMNKHRIKPMLEGTLDHVPTWGEIDHLCPEEPFAEQPAAAFCSGVLAGDGLVLTSSHCLFGTPIEDIRIVFGYYYVEAGRLAVKESDVHEVSSIVSRSSDDNGLGGVDFAWLRLAGDTRPSQTPAPVFTRNPSLAKGDAIITVNSGGGIPLKFDMGSSVLDAREGITDFFVVDTDTFRGSSGGGAFTAEGALIGSFTRGTSDFEPTENGCRTTIRRKGAEAQEQFTYVNRAVEGLCQVEPGHALCKKDCEQPCRDRTLVSIPANASSCTYTPSCPRQGEREWTSFGSFGLSIISIALRRKKRSPRK